VPAVTSATYGVLPSSCTSSEESVPGYIGIGDVVTGLANLRMLWDARRHKLKLGF